MVFKKMSCPPLCPPEKIGFRWLFVAVSGRLARTESRPQGLLSEATIPVSPQAARPAVSEREIGAGTAFRGVLICQSAWKSQPARQSSRIQGPGHGRRPLAASMSSWRRSSNVEQAKPGLGNGAGNGSIDFRLWGSRRWSRTNCRHFQKSPGGDIDGWRVTFNHPNAFLSEGGALAVVVESFPETPHHARRCRFSRHRGLRHGRGRRERRGVMGGQGRAPPGRGSKGPEPLASPNVLHWVGWLPGTARCGAGLDCPRLARRSGAPHESGAGGGTCGP